MQINVIDTECYISVSIIAEQNYRCEAEVSQLDNIYWYFNRLIIPPHCRSKSYAKQLMQKLIEVLDKNNITLLCDINPYGDLTYEQLDGLYKSYGFVDVDYIDGICFDCLIRYPNTKENNHEF